MKNVISVSYPRSGHHLLSNILFKYFSRNIEYPTYNGYEVSEKCKDVMLAGELHYCEYYNHCKKIPCTNPNTNFQKIHDFNLDHVIDVSKNYIVQVRSPIPSIISYYNYFVKTKKIDDTEENWREFSVKSATFWKEWVKKWTANAKASENLYLVRYQEFIKNPSKLTKDIISFINPGEEVDSVYLNKVIDKIGVDDERGIGDFKYYDELWFSFIEKMLCRQMKALDFELYFLKLKNKKSNHNYLILKLLYLSLKFRKEN